jgi:hypothetical protein
MIYTSTKVKVNAVYKGNLTVGQTIELIKGGGVIGFDNRVDNHGPPAVGLRRPYILFCKSINTPPVPDAGYNLSLKLSYVNDRSYLIYGEYEWKLLGFNELRFKNKADLDSILVKVPGVRLPKKKHKQSAHQAFAAVVN